MKKPNPEKAARHSSPSESCNPNPKPKPIRVLQPMDIYAEIYDETNRRAREIYAARRYSVNHTEWCAIWQTVRDERLGQDARTVTSAAKRQYAKIV